MLGAPAEVAAPVSRSATYKFLGSRVLSPLRRLGPVASTDAKLLIYGLFQKGRVLAQDGDELTDYLLSCCLEDAPASNKRQGARSWNRNETRTRAFVALAVEGILHTSVVRFEAVSITCI